MPRGQPNPDFLLPFGARTASDAGVSRLIPPKLPSTASPSVLRMFRLLRTLPDDFTVWHRTLRPDGPQFLVVWRDCHAFLLQVADTTQQLADTALQPSLFAGEESLVPDDLGHAEHEILDSFLARDLPPDLSVRRLVVFPNVAESTIDQVELLRTGETEVAFLGLHQTPEDRFARRLEALAEVPLPTGALHALRRHFTPEALIRDTPARLPLLQRSTEGLPPAFLDFDQECLTKLDIQLPEAGERDLVTTETRLITGPAGCGKSLVLLHRALLAARLNPRARLLILTHNRPIGKELRRRALATAPEGSRIRWLTYFQWAQRHLRPKPARILSAAAVECRLATLAPRIQGLRRLAPRFLAEELGYLRDLGIACREEYLALERVGRLTGLTPERRNDIWSLLELHRATMDERDESDWHECALAFHRFARDHPSKLARHDFIFIDEAQFFAKVWFGTVLAALAPGGQLFLAADSTQGFLKRRQSWLAAGVDVRGRSTRLAKPYRTTRRILAFAAKLLEQRRATHPESPMDDMDPPAAGDLAAIEEEGEAPLLVCAASPQDAVACAAREIAKLREQSPWLAGRVLLLHADSLAAADLAGAVRRRIGDDQVADLNQTACDPPTRPFCSVSNLKAATGLESAVVFLLGIDHLVASESDPRLEPGTRAEVAADHTRLLYMACTRAARRLVIFVHDPATIGLLVAAGARR